MHCKGILCVYLVVLIMSSQVAVEYTDGYSVDVEPDTDCTLVPPVSIQP